MYSPGAGGVAARMLIGLVVLSVCLNALQDVLPRVGPWLVGLVLLVLFARIVWHYTSNY